MCIDDREECCEHIVSQVYTVYEVRSRWRCCHCGIERNQIIEVDALDTTEQKGHGPFLPPNGFMAA